MRNIILSTFILIYLNSFGQTWCNTGATWKYSYTNNFATEGYVQIKYIGDTLINSQNVKKLSKTLNAYNYINSQIVNHSIGNEYTYENNGVVYIKYNNSWDTLYNFNAQIGDSWRMAKQPLTNACNSNGRLSVLATGVKTINSISLKYLVVEFNYGSSLRDTIIEKIGFIGGYMFPYDQCAATLDANEGGKFRCYSDDLFSTYKPNYSEACDFIVGIDENLLKTNLSLFPNPSNSFIEIKGDFDYEKTYYKITNFQGQELKSGILTKKINISNFPTGIYLLTINKSINQYRFIVD